MSDSTICTPFAPENLQNVLSQYSRDLSSHVSIDTVIADVKLGLCEGITQHELIELVARSCASRSTDHPDYALLAGRVVTRQELHATIPERFGDALVSLHAHVSRPSSPIVNEQLLDIYNTHAVRIEERLRNARDDLFDYFAIRTLMKSYLLRDSTGRILERPQHMYMRVALYVHACGADSSVDDALQAYDDMSTRVYTHASPTLFNAGTVLPQLSSCFLTGMQSDSVDGIFNTVKACAQVSKTAGGIGLAVSNVRASGSFIAGTQGHSNGLVPMLRVVNATARYIDQGGGKRPGAIAVYIEPWHADIEDVLLLKSNQGAEELRARDLFYALWMCDLFMQRVEANGSWSLMCPAQCPGLQDAFGQEFEDLYCRYERNGRAVRTVAARSLWARIIESQMETGNPYMLFKDHCNRKSNHNHLGTIRCSNLCTEIVQYTSKDEVAVCNLGSLCIPAFVSKGELDYTALHIAAQRLAVALDRVIDVNRYPVPEAEFSNRRHRPIGIGVQGLADAFVDLGLVYDSDEARRVNKAVFETIYHGALTASCDRAQNHGRYAAYDGSPVSRGVLQFDMWEQFDPDTLCGKWDWKALKKRIAAHGVRNSLVTAPMPTASTAQIAGNTESFEPRMSNVLLRRVTSGEFVVVNRRLVEALNKLGLWPTVRDDLLRANGSVQNLDIPAEMKRMFRTAWEMRQKPLVEMSAERAPFVDQSQSLNVFMANPTAKKIHALHFCAWKLGLKTGMYYLHTRPAVEAVQFALVGSPCESCSA